MPMASHPPEQFYCSFVGDESAKVLGSLYFDVPRAILCVARTAHAPVNTSMHTVHQYSIALQKKVFVIRTDVIVSWIVKDL